MATPLTGFREFWARTSPTSLQAEFGAKFVSGVIGLFGDMIQNLANMGLKAPWLKTETSPDDALPLVGEGSNLVRYFTDTETTYRARLNDRWNTWELAGTKAQLQAQAVLMGFPNALVKEPVDWPDKPPLNYWSQFWLFIPQSDHNFTGGPNWDDPGLVWDGFAWSVSGANAFEIIQSLKAAMCLFKPGHVILREIIFETGNFTYDTGSSWDDPGLVWGADANIVIPVSC